MENNSEYQKEWRKNHPDKILEYEINRDMEKARETQKRYYEAHKEECLEKVKKYRETHREEIRERAREYARLKREVEKKRRIEKKAEQERLMELSKGERDKAKLAKTVDVYLSMKEQIEANRRKRVRREWIKKK